MSEPTSRELVYQALAFQNPIRPPRQLWVLPWAEYHHAEALAAIRRDFPDDIVQLQGGQKVLPPTEGDPYEVGIYRDEWGVRFENVQRGVIGEVKNPIVTGEDWEDANKVRFPVEWLDVDREFVNLQCAQTRQFALAGVCPRPFEQLQFLRGTANLYMDIASRSCGMLVFLEKLHDFYCRLLEVWARTDVDGLMMMDDWGSQRSLLIHPKAWEELFKPLYRDYINIAKKHGKKIFMHSDGNTLDIIPHLIDLGLDALNTQIFCIGLESLRQFKGRLTFWGEIDRQHSLVDASLEEVKAAVRGVYDALWADGGCIAQCEFGPGGKPANVRAVYQTWNELF